MSFTHTAKDVGTKLLLSRPGSGGGGRRSYVTVAHRLEFGDLIVYPSLLRLKPLDCSVDDLVTVFGLWPALLR